MREFANITEAFGNTPLVKLNRIPGDTSCEIYAKLEFYNPAGSVKDRIGIAIIDAAERSGALKPGGTVVEGTSGNTGVGLAMVGAARGYRVILCMPETMSIERRKLLAAYGAEIVLTPGAEGMRGAVAKATEIAEATPGAVLARQFANTANPEIHFKTTGPEIWRDTDGTVDIFVAGVGTGGTVTGVGRYLKQQNPNVQVVAVEPADSPLLSTGQAGPHKIQGIGANFVPDILDCDIYDEVIPVTLDDSVESAKQLGKTEAILAGISGGAAVAAAVQIAQRPENSGKKIVVLIPDFGERYFSTLLYADLDV